MHARIQNKTCTNQEFKFCVHTPRMFRLVFYACARNLIFWHLNISKCATKRNTETTKNDRAVKFGFCFIFSCFYLFICLLFLLHHHSTEETKIRFLCYCHGRPLCHMKLQNGLYLFVVASLQLNRSTVFKLLGPCFRWLTQSFKLLADSLLLFESNEPISERKIHSICSLLRSTCFPFLDHHMCDDGLIVK